MVLSEAGSENSPCIELAARPNGWEEASTLLQTRDYQLIQLGGAWKTIENMKTHVHH